MMKLPDEQLVEISKTVHGKMISESTNQMIQATVEISLDVIVEFMKEYQKQIGD